MSYLKIGDNRKRKYTEINCNRENGIKGNTIKKTHRDTQRENAYEQQCTGGFEEKTMNSCFGYAFQPIFTM